MNNLAHDRQDDTVAGFMKSVRELLKSERIRQRIPQDELAGKIGRSRKWLSEFERGIGDPSIEAVARLAGALGVTITFRQPAGIAEKVSAGDKPLKLKFPTRGKSAARK